MRYQQCGTAATEPPLTTVGLVHDLRRPDNPAAYSMCPNRYRNTGNGASIATTLCNNIYLRIPTCSSPLIYNQRDSEIRKTLKVQKKTRKSASMSCQMCQPLASAYPWLTRGSNSTCEEQTKRNQCHFPSSHVQLSTSPSACHSVRTLFSGRAFPKPKELFLRQPPPPRNHKPSSTESKALQLELHDTTKSCSRHVTATAVQLERHCTTAAFSGTSGKLGNQNKPHIWGHTTAHEHPKHIWQCRKRQPTSLMVCKCTVTCETPANQVSQQYLSRRVHNSVSP